MFKAALFRQFFLLAWQTWREGVLKMYRYNFNSLPFQQYIECGERKKKTLLNWVMHYLLTQNPFFKLNKSVPWGSAEIALSLTFMCV